MQNGVSHGSPSRGGDREGISGSILRVLLVELVESSAKNFDKNNSSDFHKNRIAARKRRQIDETKDMLRHMAVDYPLTNPSSWIPVIY